MQTSQLPSRSAVDPYKLGRVVKVINSDSTDCPPYGCMQITGLTMSVDGPVYATQRPDGGSSDYGFVFCSKTAIAAGTNGTATMDFPCNALWDTGTPAVNDLWGPKNGQWSLTKGSGSVQWPVLGIVDSDNQWMKIGPSPGSSPGIPVYNPSSGTTIAAYSVMKVTSVSGGVCQVGQPDTSLDSKYLINGASAIQPMSSGTALPFGAIKIPSIGATAGDCWGPTPSSWSLTKGNPGCFEILGDDGTWTWGVWRPITSIVVMTPSGGISALSSDTPGSASCAVYANSSGSTVLTSTTFTATILNPATSAAAGSTLLEAIWDNGRWYSVPLSSSPTAFCWWNHAFLNGNSKFSNVTFSTQYITFTSTMGSASSAQITDLSGSATNSVPPFFETAADGLWSIDVRAQVIGYYTGSDWSAISPTGSAPNLTVSGPASAGTAHTHSNTTYAPVVMTARFLIEYILPGGGSSTTAENLLFTIPDFNRKNYLVLSSPAIMLNVPSGTKVQISTNVSGLSGTFFVIEDLRVSVQKVGSYDSSQSTDNYN